MTNKPMLSVERELLERCLTVLALSPTGLYRELRALLDAQHAVCSNGILCQNSKCAECGGNGAYKPVPFPGYPPAPEDRKLPAAQHHGEPTPITDEMDRLMEAYRRGEFSAEGGSDTAGALAVASFDSVKSHDHDADSYMAGYCAALYEQTKPFIWLALLPKAEQPAPVATVAKFMQAVHEVEGFPGVTGDQLRELADRLNGVKP